jgi:hypothetical protein
MGRRRARSKMGERPGGKAWGYSVDILWTVHAARLDLYGVKMSDGGRWADLYSGKIISLRTFLR